MPRCIGEIETFGFAPSIDMLHLKNSVQGPDFMDADTQRPNNVRTRSSTHAEREPGLLSGLASLLPRLGYTGVLPSVSFERQERPRVAESSLLRSRASSVGSDDSSVEGTSSGQDSSEVLLPAEQSEVSTSGRTGQDTSPIADSTAAAAAERHRLGAGSSIDLQVCHSSQVTSLCCRTRVLKVLPT